MRTRSILFFCSVMVWVACNNKPIPRATIQKKSDDAVPLSETEATQLYLQKQIALKEFHRDSYRSAMIGQFLAGTVDLDSTPQALVIVNFTGAAYADASDLYFQHQCSLAPGQEASQLSLASQEMVMSALTATNPDTTFINVSDFAAGTVNDVVIHIGGTDFAYDCIEKDVAGLSMVDYGNVFPEKTAIIFDPPNETPEALSKLVENILIATNASLGKIELLPSHKGFSGVIQANPIDFATTQTLAGLSRGISGLQPTDTADIEAMMPQIEAVVSSEALPVAGLDAALTVIALAASSESNQHSNKFDIDQAVQALGQAANSPAAEAITTIATAAGHPEIAIALTFVKNLIGQKKSDLPVDPTPVTLPALNTLLNLKYASDSAADCATLLTGFSDFNRYLEKSFSGDTREALRAVTFVAFAQTFKSE